MKKYFGGRYFQENSKENNVKIDFQIFRFPYHFPLKISWNYDLEKIFFKMLSNVFEAGFFDSVKTKCSGWSLEPTRQATSTKSDQLQSKSLTRCFLQLTFSGFEMVVPLLNTSSSPSSLKSVDATQNMCSVICKKKQKSL